MNLKHIALKAALFVLMTTAAGSQTTNAVFRKVFNGITAATTSAAITNSGQTMHLVYVFFPTQGSTQSGLQVRIEASYDNTIYFPISQDITEAASVGGIVYNIESAFGPWPYVRIRSLTVAPAAMTVYYAGHTLPAVSTIQERSDRFIL